MRLRLPTGVVGVVSVTCDVLLEVLHLEVLHLDFRTNKSPEKVVPVISNKSKKSSEKFKDLFFSSEGNVSMGVV